MLRHKRGNLCARLLLAVVFLTVSTVGFLPEMSRADHAPQDTAVVMSPAGTLSSPSALLSGIPQEFGTIQNMDEALPLFSEFKSDQLPWVIHIQDAHSNPSVQTNMLGILEYLSRGTADLYVGVEGAAGPLHPEYFDIFPGHPSAGDAIIDDLLAKGELSGVERFAWNQYRQKAGHKPVSGNRDSESLPGASVFGIENLDYYRDNLRTFRTLLSAGGAIQDALDRMREGLETEKSRMMNGQLRDFLRERDRRKSGNFGGDGRKSDGNLAVYLSFLEQRAAEVLGIDLGQPIEQIRFPNLVRIHQLRSREKSYQREAAAEEWRTLFKLFRAKAESAQDRAWLQTLDYFARQKGVLTGQNLRTGEEPGNRPVSSDTVSDLYPRRLFEKIYLFAQKTGLDLSRYPQFCESWRMMIWESEMETEDLSKEMDELESYVIGKLARSEEDQKMVRQLENFRLLEKLIHLELTLPEFRKVGRREADLREMARAYKEPIQKNVGMEKVYDTALHFYEVAHRRDLTLIENALETARRLKKEKGGDEMGTKPMVLVLVTGGFHASGIREYLKAIGVPYAAVLPRVSDFDRGERYGRAMSGGNADLSGYFKSSRPFATKQEAMLFKEMLEVGVPALVKAGEVDPSEIPDLVRTALKGHPVLKKALSSEIFGDDRQRFVRVMPVMPMPENGIQSASLMPEILSAPTEFQEGLRDFGSIPPKPVSLDLEWDSNGILHFTVTPPAETIQVGNLEIMSGQLPPGASPSMIQPVLPARTQVSVLPVPALQPPPLVSEPRPESRPDADIWSFFSEGRLNARLEKCLLEAITKVGDLEGGGVFVQGLGTVVLPFVNGTREAEDFEAANSKAVSLLNVFRLKVRPYRNFLDQIVAQNPDEFAILGNFLKAVDRADLASLGVSGPLSTVDYEAFLRREFPQNGFDLEDPKFPEDLQEAKTAVAERLGAGFSERDIRGFLSPSVRVSGAGYDGPQTVNAGVAARLWIASALLRSSGGAAIPVGVSNAALDALVGSFLGEGGEATFTEKPFLHVQLPELSEEQLGQLSGDLIPVFAAAILANVSIRFNFDQPQDEVDLLFSRIREIAERGGVSWPDGQFRFLAVQGKQSFVSLPAKPQGLQAMLGPENVMAKVVLRKDIGARYEFGAGEKDPKKIAANVLVIVKNLLKKQLGDRYTVINAEKNFPEEFGLAVNLLEKYLTEIAIQTSA